jgi:ATP-dependent helicase/nuclease subunit A
VWYTGVFDRVIVERDAQGRAGRAWVFDFKTDRAKTGEEDARIIEKHAGQLNLYRRVAGILTGLWPGQVRCALVMTASRRLLEVPVPG